jgi:hypothetical protein
MEVITNDAWMQALLQINEGARLNQLMSIMTGGQIQSVQWLNDAPAEAVQQAEYLQAALQNAGVESQFIIPAEAWQAAGLIRTDEGCTGLLVTAAYAQQGDFHQAALQAKLQWLQQMQHLNNFPVRMLLLAFSKVPDVEYEQPGMLDTWQWEELLETGMHMAIGQQADLAEVMILPMVAYPAWLEQ